MTWCIGDIVEFNCSRALNPLYHGRKAIIRIILVDGFGLQYKIQMLDNDEIVNIYRSTYWIKKIEHNRNGANS